MTDVPPPADPRDEPYYDPRRDDRDGRDGGHGWQLVAVGLIALLLGVGATYLVKDSDGGDTETEVRTVQRESQTVTVQAAPSATEAVTVTQPPAETVTRTTTLTVTVPTVGDETATEP
jgi:hypothetical protein